MGQFSKLLTELFTFGIEISLYTGNMKLAICDLLWKVWFLKWKIKFQDLTLPVMG